MYERRKQAWAAAFIGNVLIHTVVIASPIYVPQFLPGSTGRNIRHLPCVSRRSGETGVCMFAFTCAKANGTHLGTCIDRFYFGSCCKIDDEPDIFPQDNSIDDGPPRSPPRPFITTHGPIESNDIPEYFARPRPTDAKKPAGTVETTTTPIISSTQSVQTSASTLKDTTKFVTKKPTITTIETTTQTTKLSTFQTVQNAAEVGSSTEATLSKNSTTVNGPASVSPSTTRQPMKPSTLASILRPSVENVTKLTSTATTSKATTKKPFITPLTTVQRPTQTSQKPIPSTTRRPPLQSTTTRNVLTTTQKIVPATRFPPRNTTSVKPTTTQQNTRKPISSTKRPATVTVTTKRPSVTTKRPSTKRPTNSSSRPSTSSSSSSATLLATTKPHATSAPFNDSSTSSTSVTQSTLTSNRTKPATATTWSTSVSTSQKVSATTKIPSDQKLSTTRPSTTPRPSTKTTTRTSSIRSTTVRSTTTKATSTSRTTTSRPLSSTTATRLKPTKSPSTTTKTTSRPEYTSSTTVTTERTRPLSSSVGSTVGVTRPRPTTTRPKPLTKVPVSTSTVSGVPASSSSLTSTSRNETTSTYVPPTKGQSANNSLEEIPVTTYSPGIVTWSSNSDEPVTKVPETSTSTATSSEQAETDWSPITTPDGWIMIQSPTTEKIPQTQESTTEPVAESTIQSLTSAKPITESTIIPDYVTKTPTIATLLSTIASVTIDTELPVPMETFNMSDYKQVCGRRLFPESRIVGGNRSSFGKWPWQISLRQWRSQTYLHKCGAALLNENWAITAAHCVESVPPSDLLLRIGEHDLANEDEPYGYQERRVQIVASHPQFDARTFEYDLALLRFYEPLLPFQPNVLPICLPDDDETYVGHTAYVTGWGRLYDEGPLPSILQEVAVPVINNTVCEAMYKNAGYIEHIPHIFICAGWRNGGFDSCEGDSGGPMVIQRTRDKRWILAGIISWGIGCAAPNQPGVYTRISEFREWINQILQF